jgi:diamine N-acetyltransferase
MLSGKQIYLRGVEAEDISLIEKWENDPKNWVHSGTLIPFSKKSIEDYVLAIRDLHTDKQCRWIISRLEDDVAIGAIDLFEFDALHRRAGIGIVIEEDQQQKGYGSEAISLLCEYAFAYLNLNQVWAAILSKNENSKRLFEKNQFEKTASKRKWIVNNGEWYDELLYQRFNPNTL